MDDATDEKMEQVRELLFGNYQRATENHVAELERRMREMEARIGQRLDAMAARIEALSGEVEASQRTTLEEIGRSMQDVSDRLRSIRRG